MKKSKKITAIVLAAMAVIIAIFFIVRGMGAKKVENEPKDDNIRQEHQTEEKTQSISYDDLKGYILSFTGDAIDKDSAKCYLDDDGKLILEGEITKSAAENMLEQAGSDSGIYKSVLKLMPEKLPMSMEAEVKYDDGKAEVDIDSLKAGEIEIPEDLIPDSLTGEINNQLNKAIKEKYGDFSDIQMNENEITIYP